MLIVLTSDSRQSSTSQAAPRDARSVHSVARAGQPSRRSGLRPRYRRRQTPTMQLVRAVQDLTVKSRLVLIRMDQILGACSQPADRPVYVDAYPTLWQTRLSHAPIYCPPSDLGPGSGVAYSKGVWDAYNYLAPHLYPSIKFLPEHHDGIVDWCLSSPNADRRVTTPDPDTAGDTVSTPPPPCDGALPELS